MTAMRLAADGTRAANGQAGNSSIMGKEGDKARHLRAAVRRLLLRLRVRSLPAREMRSSSAVRSTKFKAQAAMTVTAARVHPAAFFFCAQA
jgi:hypothetical protein